MTPPKKRRRVKVSRSARRVRVSVAISEQLDVGARLEYKIMERVASGTGKPQRQRRGSPLLFSPDGVVGAIRRRAGHTTSERGFYKQPNVRNHRCSRTICALESARHLDTGVHPISYQRPNPTSTLRSLRSLSVGFARTNSVVRTSQE